VAKISKKAPLILGKTRVLEKRAFLSLRKGRKEYSWGFPLNIYFFPLFGGEERRSGAWFSLWGGGIIFLLTWLGLKFGGIWGNYFFSETHRICMRQLGRF